MKYLFIILIAFSFIGCDGEEPNPTRTVYATFTLISNPENASYLQVWLHNGTIMHQEPNGSPVPVGFSLTTAEYSFLKDFNCTAMALSTGASGLSSNNEIEIKLYVDGDLAETRVVNGASGQTNFIIP